MAYRRTMGRRPSKYGARKVEVDGIVFDSKKEAHRYGELKVMAKAGLITGLELQKKFVLIPAQREPDTIGKRGGRIKGKLLEHEVAYYADFYYFDCMSQEWVCEDTKGMRTPEYIIKRKLLLWIHKIRINEV